MEKKITIGIFNDAYYPAVDGVVMVVDNYAKLLSKVANVILFVPDYKLQCAVSFLSLLRLRLL